MIELNSDMTLSLFSGLISGRTFALLSASWCIYLTALAIYRGLSCYLNYFEVNQAQISETVYFSPIARFPGPKLAGKLQRLSG